MYVCAGMCVRVRAPGGSVETKGFLIGHVQTNVRDWSNGLGWKCEDRAH